MAFNPDGKTVASAIMGSPVADPDNKTIKLWDVTSGKERAIFEGHTAFVLDADGRWKPHATDWTVARPPTWRQLFPRQASAADEPTPDGRPAPSQPQASPIGQAFAVACQAAAAPLGRHGTLDDG